MNIYCILDKSTAHNGLHEIFYLAYDKIKKLNFCGKILKYFLPYNMNLQKRNKKIWNSLVKEVENQVEMEENKFYDPI